MTDLVKVIENLEWRMSSHTLYFSDDDLMAMNQALNALRAQAARITALEADNARLREAIQAHMKGIHNARNRDAEGYVYGYVDNKLYDALKETK